MRTTLTFAGFLLAVVASGACGSVGNLIVYDDALESGVDCSDSAGSVGPITFNNPSPVHAGVYSIRISDSQRFAVGWCSPTMYSIAGDYDGISFWVNGGANGGEDVNLVLYDDVGVSVRASLAALYGTAIPINTWVHIQTSFFSPVFENYYGDSATFNQIVFRVESDTGGTNAFFFLDDISLIGADIFKDGFEN